MAVQILDGTLKESITLIAKGRRPLMRRVPGKDKPVMMVNESGHAILGFNYGLAIHSFLLENEWKELDQTVYQLFSTQLNAVMHLRQRGLIHNTGGIWAQLSTWNVASEKPEPNVAMSGRTRGDRDRVDKKQYGVPLPIIFDEFDIEIRELEASRRFGSDVDMTEAATSARAVGEQVERILFNGYDITLGGNQLFGYLNVPGTDAVTAAGDFGTISNIYTTYKTAMAQQKARGYRGPWGIYVANTQYFEMLEFYNDGSEDRAIDRVARLPGVEFVEPSDFLTAGTSIMVQLTPDVVDLAIGLDLTNREWTSPDGMAVSMKVLTVAAPRIKRDYAGNTGISIITGA